MKQRLIWLLPVAIATMACAPGEVERRLTEEPSSMSCPAILILAMVCSQVRDGKQECHMESRPPTCEPDPKSVVTICLPASAAKVGEQ